MEDTKCSEYKVCSLQWNKDHDCDSCEWRKIRLENEERQKQIMERVEPIDTIGY